MTSTRVIMIQLAEVLTTHFSVVGWQGYVPSYSYVSFTDDTFTIKTYAANDYTIGNQSLIDSYTITKK